MKNVLTPSQMKAVEKTAIEEIGIPSLALMERAAAAVADELRGRLAGQPSVIAVCGTGNNGADGLAAARMLHLAGWPVRFVIVGDRARATREWGTQYAVCKNLGVPEAEEIAAADVVIDALFGIGLSRELSGDAAEAVRKMNEMTAFKAAVDMPSGISGATGAVLGEAFAADLTVTFQYRKAGQILYPGRRYCGETVCADIGIPPAAASVHAAVCWDDRDLALFTGRPQDSNKGTFGRVLVVAGSVNMCGAAYLSALAAYRSGAGLVEVFTPWENRIPLQTRLPEAVLTCYDAEDPDTAELAQALARADAVVAGPGLSTADASKKLVRYILQHCAVPLVLDADALNILAQDRGMLSLLHAGIIITPHLKEMSRLTGKTVAEIKGDPAGNAARFAAEHRAVVVQKDAATVTADPDGAVCINTSGCSAMATGGSGDVLAGMIGARAAVSRGKLFENAAGCVFLHGRAGEEAARQKGEAAVMAQDIADHIGVVLCRI